MRNGAVRPAMMVMSPSKKKMLRQVWMTMLDAPHGGIRESLKSISNEERHNIQVTHAVARRPPKAPAIDAAET